jgi:hypothetical protein
MDQQGFAIRPYGFCLLMAMIPTVETPTNAHEMNIRLNRVSGRVQVDVALA